MLMFRYTRYYQMMRQFINILHRNKLVILVYIILTIIMSVFISIYSKINILLVFKGFLLSFMALYFPGMIIYNAFEKEINIFENIAMSICISIIFSTIFVLTANILFKIKITILSSLVSVIVVCLLAILIFIIHNFLTSKK